MLAAYDWLAHLVGRSRQWGEYGTSLREIIETKLSPQDSLIVGWKDAVIGSPLSLPTLLNRHYLVDTVLREEIFTNVNYPPLFVLMAAMLTETTIFSPLYKRALWEGIDTDPHPINALRLRRPLLHQYAHELANREDITSHRLIRDHGLLSSLSLLYGLYLIRVVLIYETTVRPNAALAIISESLSNTLTTLKGVFNNVETNWLGTHVR